MNTLDAEILKIFDIKKSDEYDFWTAKAIITTYGREQETLLVGKTEKEIRDYKIGDIVQV